MTTNITAIRNRCWLNISPATAAAGNMTLGELKQFCVLAYTPTQQQLHALSLYFRCGCYA